MFYTFDGSGIAAANLVSNENHVISSSNGSDHNYLVPRDAPFYNKSMVVVDADSGDILVEDTDYEFAWTFNEGESETGLSMSGSILLIDKLRTGTFKLRYQTIGGDFVTNTTRAINDGLATLIALRTTSWEALTGVPPTFPPTPHTQSVTEIESVTQIISEITRLVDALTTAPPYIKIADVQDLDTGFINPLITSINSIASAMNAKQYNTLHYETVKFPLITKVVTGVNDTVWTDSGLILEVTVSGTFMPSIDFKPLVGISSDTLFQNRILISKDNGATYIDLYIPPGYPVGLQDGWFLKHQFRTVGSTPGNVTVAHTQFTSSLTIIRLGI